MFVAVKDVVDFSYMFGASECPSCEIIQARRCQAQPAAGLQDAEAFAQHDISLFAGDVLNDLLGINNVNAIIGQGQGPGDVHVNVRARSDIRCQPTVAENVAAAEIENFETI